MLAALKSVIDIPNFQPCLQILVARLLIVEELWKKIDEVEENFNKTKIGRGSTNTLVDSEKTLKLISQIISSTSREINVIFPSQNVAKSFLLEGSFDLQNRQLTKNQIQIRILIKENGVSTDCPLLETFRFKYEHNDLHPQLQVDLRFVRNLQTQMTTVIVDREKLLSVELKDELEHCFLNSIGSAIYSDNTGIIASHLAVFEIWWIRSQYSST